jgi:hypothetical protein
MDLSAPESSEPTETPPEVPAQEQSPGEIAYQAYFDAVGGRAYDGHALQTWDGFNHHPIIRNAWEKAAQAVLDHFQTA